MFPFVDNAIHHDATAPDVHWFAVRLIVYQFWSHVQRGPALFGKEPAGILGNHGTQPKITQFN